MSMSSSQFSNKDVIPAKYTCDGLNVSPPLRFAEIPANTQALPITMEDPDAQDASGAKRTFVHWVLYNVPSTMNGMREGVRVSALAGAAERRPVS